MSAPDRVFARRSPGEAPPSAVHGLGIGLPLSRELARRRGGEVWLIDAAGAGAGAVFGARLPGCIRPAHRQEDT
ncbi:ATP-binding protein [Microbacterium sp. SORGH_AS_0888]|uniref:ATP-binding protein n=1 Tax=Microbacterium sp. SORGH_AS_0888 TaxID=3041791 RepID=UPI0027D81104|nr:ATP-binding protein [Microbacterium sp. SORGH_AS_0888]